MVSSPYTVKLSPRINKQLRNLTATQRQLAIRLADALAINPRPPAAKRIEGMIGLHSEALENVRIIYKIADQDIILLFLQILK